MQPNQNPNLSVSVETGRLVLGFIWMEDQASRFFLKEKDEWSPAL